MTLTFETRIIAALYDSKLPGSAERIAAAADARHEREALFHVESAELLQQLHARTPFTAILPDSRANVAARAGGQALVLLPMDWLRRTEAAESILLDVDGRARKELKATALVIVLTGKASAEASKAFAARGWTIATP